MNRFFTILLTVFFFCVSLLPYLSTRELEKLPNLVEHYNTEHSDFGFFAFLVKHYTQNEHTKKERHSDLPLQGAVSGGLLLIAGTCVSFQLKPVLVFQTVQKPLTRTFSVQTGYCHTIFQPPRSC